MCLKTCLSLHHCVPSLSQLGRVFFHHQLTFKGKSKLFSCSFFHFSFLLLFLNLVPLSLCLLITFLPLKTMEESHSRTMTLLVSFHPGRQLSVFCPGTTSPLSSGKCVFDLLTTLFLVLFLALSSYMQLFYNFLKICRMTVIT